MNNENGIYVNRTNYIWAHMNKIGKAWPFPSTSKICQLGPLLVHEVTIAKPFSMKMTRPYLLHQLVTILGTTILSKKVLCVHFARAKVSTIMHRKSTDRDGADPTKILCAFIVTKLLIEPPLVDLFLKWKGV